MKPVGVLVFSDKKSIRVGRDGRSDYSFDGLGWKGLNKILSELDRPYEFCSGATLNDYDDVLCSMTSYHDVLNILINVPVDRSARVHVGGPACNNIRPILSRIDTANFGRCDCGKISRILDGERIDSVWRKEHDPDFSGEYAVDVSSQAGLSDVEASFGCRQKCAFCFYSYWNGFVSRDESRHYASGFANYEDFFQHLDWGKCIRGGVTALDGITQETRLRVRKPITTEKITETLLRSNSLNTDTRLRVKIYCIAGYPWESADEIGRLDLLPVLRTVAPQLKNKITMRMHFSHFIPFQKTPLWSAPFNFHNYREWCLARSLLFESEGIRLFSGGTFTPSPATAAESTIIQRSFNGDAHIVEKMAGRKWQALSPDVKVAVMKKELSRFFCEQERETIGNIKTPNNYQIKINYSGS